MRDKNKVCVFSTKIIAEVFNTDNILVDKIKFAERIEAPTLNKAFQNVLKKIRRKAARHGYRRENGYRFQYRVYSPFKKLWERTL